jgi:hypothetical protein
MNDFGTPKRNHQLPFEYLKNVKQSFINKQGEWKTFLSYGLFASFVVGLIVFIIYIIGTGGSSAQMQSRKRATRRSSNVRENYTDASGRPDYISEKDEKDLQKLLYSTTPGSVSGTTDPCASANQTAPLPVYRSVKCFSSTGRIMPDPVPCDIASKPKETETIPLPPTCPTFQWKATDWKTSLTDSNNDTIYKACAGNVCTGAGTPISVGGGSGSGSGAGPKSCVTPIILSNDNSTCVDFGPQYGASFCSAEAGQTIHSQTCNELQYVIPIPYSDRTPDGNIWFVKKPLSL